MVRDVEHLRRSRVSLKMRPPLIRRVSEQSPDEPAPGPGGPARSPAIPARPAWADRRTSFGHVPERQRTCRGWTPPQAAMLSAPATGRGAAQARGMIEVPSNSSASGSTTCDQPVDGRSSRQVGMFDRSKIGQHPRKSTHPQRAKRAQPAARVWAKLVSRGEGDRSLTAPQKFMGAGAVCTSNV
jgi:hypothetical protein